MRGVLAKGETFLRFLVLQISVSMETVCCLITGNSEACPALLSRGVLAGAVTQKTRARLVFRRLDNRADTPRK
jgi:hypothetical protein